MFFTEFGSILDIYTWHFISAIGVSLVAIVVTFLVSKKMIHEDKGQISNDLHKENGVGGGKHVAAGRNSDTSEQKLGLKSSPAVFAERVIKENMTEEQRTLEQQVRQKQLAEIFKLMQKETEKFGDISLSELEDQMRMYQ